MHILLIEDDAVLAAMPRRLVRLAESLSALGQEATAQRIRRCAEAIELDGSLDSPDPGRLGDVLRTLRLSDNRTNAPIVYDREHNGYCYDQREGQMYELPGLWFNASELHALLTVQQLLATPGDVPETHFSVGDLELDLLTREVTRAGKKIPLQPREFRLLEYLMRHAGQVVTEAEARAKLPPQMVPRELRVVAEMPLTLSGKIDRKQLD